jgi:hypothetical protein
MINCKTMDCHVHYWLFQFWNVKVLEMWTLQPLIL